MGRQGLNILSSTNNGDMEMENRIRQWLEGLDLFSIKSEDGMKLAYHRFISGCKDAGLDARLLESAIRE